MVSKIKHALALALVSLSLLYVSGCLDSSAKSPVTESTMNSVAVEEFMFVHTGEPIQGHAIADGVYAMPSERWIDASYSTDLKGFQIELKTSKWVAEGNDCDDFARGAAHFAQVLHHNTPHKTTTGLLLGEFWYYRDSGNGAHAINFAIVNDSVTKKPKLIFYEPQIQRQVQLSTNEVWNCIHWRL